jgi:hypothetical protein
MSEIYCNIALYGAMSYAVQGVVIGRGPTAVKKIMRLRLQKFVPSVVPQPLARVLDHGLTSKLNIYTQIKNNIYIYIIKLKGPRGYPKDITPEQMFRKY